MTPIETPAGAALIGTGAGAVIVTVLAPLGLDVIAMGAGLCGCVVVRTLLPSPSLVSKKEIALVTLGSVVFASFATPWLLPWLLRGATLVQVDIGPVQGKASAAFLAGAFPKPLLMFGKFALDGLIGKAAAILGKERHDTK